MACKLPPLDKLTNNQSFITAQQLESAAVSEIASQLGLMRLGAEAFGPLAPFIWAGTAIYDIVSMFGGGRPKFEDTDNVINAYRNSAYWPMQALGRDLAAPAFRETLAQPFYTADARFGADDTKVR